MSNALDRLIEYVAPTWGATRRAARLGLTHTENLASPEGQPGRLDRAPTFRGASADAELESANDRRALVDRARAADATNLFAGALLDRSVESVVGDGFRLQALSGDKTWNDEAERLWAEWSSDAAAVDTRGLLTLPEVVATLYRSCLRDGDVGCVLNADGTVRIVESDEIADPAGAKAESRVDGVELDARGRPTGYHVVTASNDTRLFVVDRRAAPKTTLVPAEDFLFFARRTRAGQTRGVTNFRGLFWMLDQIDGTFEAVTVKTRMAACLGLVIKRAGGSLSGLPTTTDSKGATRRKLSLEPGAVLPLEVGEDATTIQGADPSANVRDHLRELALFCCARFPVTREMVFGDYTASNLSNSRNARMEAGQRAKRQQGPLRSVVYSPMYRWKIDAWIRDGKLKDRDDAFSHSFTPPAWPLVDPLTEVQTSQALIDGSFSDYETETARLTGREFEDVVPRLAKNVALLASHKITPVRGTLTREVADATADPKKAGPAGGRAAPEPPAP